MFYAHMLYTQLLDSLMRCGLTQVRSMHHIQLDDRSMLYDQDKCMACTVTQVMTCQCNMARAAYGKGSQSGRWVCPHRRSEACCLTA